MNEAVGHVCIVSITNRIRKLAGDWLSSSTAYVPSYQKFLVLIPFFYWMIFTILDYIERSFVVALVEVLVQVENDVYHSCNLHVAVAIEH